jgi:hypothetical protein
LDGRASTAWFGKRNAMQKYRNFANEITQPKSTRQQTREKLQLLDVFVKLSYLKNHVGPIPVGNARREVPGHERQVGQYYPALA